MPEPAVERFGRELAREQLADAYLFVGPSRARLRVVVLECAGLALGAGPRPETHADCVLFDPQELGVAGLRVEHVASRKEGVLSVEESLRYRPAEGGRRAVILLDADRMGADAQAALLKTAEEPPPGTLILLTAADLSPLLPALRSRCRTYRSGPPTAAELARRAASEAGLEGADWEALGVALGGGESALDLVAGERARLLAVHAAFQDWLRDGGRADGWLQEPEGSLAEQRELGGRTLAACLGWMARAYPQADPAAARMLDSLAGLLAEAASDLRRQLTPQVIFEDLRRRVEKTLVAA